MTESDGIYHLEEGATPAEEQQKGLSSRLKIFVGLAALFAVAFVALIVMMVIRNNQADDTIYTVNTSTYGIPDGCEDYTALCAENTETGQVSCTCGNYLFEYYNGVWVQQ